MQCPRCQAQLPDDARFCGMCGNRFGAAAPAPGGRDAEFQSLESMKSQPAKTMVETPIRFFQENTGTTDRVRAEELRKIAEQAMRLSVPPPSATPSPQPAASAAPAAPAPAGAAPAKPAAFEFRPEDLRTALERAALQEGQTVPDTQPSDVTHFYKLGEAAGISRKTLGDALHRASAERAGVRVDAPLTMELQPIQPSRKKVALVAAGVAAGLVLVVLGVMRGEEPQAVVTAVAEPVPVAPPVAAADAGAPAAKRKQGTLDTAALTRVWEDVTRKAEQCHEAARKKNPKLGGRLVFDVEFAEDGTFSRLEVKEDGVKDAGLLGCVQGHMKAATWPHPQGGVFAAEFPLTFQVTEQAAPRGKTGKQGKGRKR
jgi:hypothetical protein